MKLLRLSIMAAISLFTIFSCKNDTIDKLPESKKEIQYIEGKTFIKIAECAWVKDVELDSCEYYSIGNAATSDLYHKPRCKYCLKRSDERMRLIILSVIESRDSVNALQNEAKGKLLSHHFDASVNHLVYQIRANRISDSLETIKVLNALSGVQILNHVDFGVASK